MKDKPNSLSIFLSKYKIFKWFAGLSKMTKWLTSGSLTAVIVLTFSLNWSSAYFFDLVHPGTQKETLNVTQNNNDKLSTIENSLDSNDDKLLAIESSLDKLIKKNQIDKAKLRLHLSKLSRTNRLKSESEINSLYAKNTISEQEKDVLLLFIEQSIIFDNDLNKKIENSEKQGKTETANNLKEVQDNFINGNAEQIKKEYYLRKSSNIEYLKESIKAMELLQASEEVIELYEELVLFEKSAYNYAFLATKQLNIQQYDAALLNYQKTLDILAQGNEKETPFSGEIHQYIGYIYIQKNSFVQAAENLDLAINITEETFDLEIDYLSSFYAKLLSERGNLYYLNGKNELALKYYNKSLKQYEQATRFDDWTTLSEANVNVRIAKVYSSMGRFEDANTTYLNTLETYETLKALFPEKKTYILEYAHICGLIGKLNSNQEKYDSSISYYQKELDILNSLEQNKVRYPIISKAKTLGNLSISYFLSNDSINANESLNEAILIFEQLAKEQPEVYGIDYALGIMTRYQMFKEDKDDLTIAENILRKYPDAPEALSLLNKLSSLL